jgi:predicted amidophosphoribosyltransferase
MLNAGPKTCPKCARESSSECERCIFCWAALSPNFVRWRNVYHAVNSIDA